MLVAPCRSAMGELPPRARRIQHPIIKPAIGNGTTSACAENTSGPPHATNLHGNYLRVRGEYAFRHALKAGHRELPPRARRIQRQMVKHAHSQGTTSACAENTEAWPQGCQGHGNYLRVRGEYFACASKPLAFGELPPRARRIPNIKEQERPAIGTTSACAENTQTLVGDVNNNGNYLRVRGEYQRLSDTNIDLRELPPRARRIPNHRNH